MSNRILFVTQTAFHPPYQGDSARVAALIRYFRQRGWYVSVAHLHDRAQVNADYAGMAGRCDELHVYRPTDEELGRRKSSDLDAWCPAKFSSLVLELCQRQRTDVLVIQCVFLTRCFELLRGNYRPLKVLDADNVFSDRAKKFRCANIEYDWFSTDERQERQALRRADLILGIQENEVSKLRQMSENKPVMLVPHVRDTAFLRTPQGKNILFVGADNAENIAGIRKFAEEAMPDVLSRCPGARLIIVGRVGEYVASDAFWIQRFGVVSNPTPYYEQASIVINTTECGTGLKIKTVDALCHGRCLVTTPAGIEGLERYTGLYFVAHSPAEFARTIVRLLDNVSEMVSTGRRAVEFASIYFNPTLVLGRLEREVLKRLDHCA
jgi:hypothetical protein